MIGSDVSADLVAQHTGFCFPGTHLHSSAPLSVWISPITHVTKGFQYEAVVPNEFRTHALSVQSLFGIVSSSSRVSAIMAPNKAASSSKLATKIVFFGATLVFAMIMFVNGFSP